MAVAMVYPESGKGGRGKRSASETAEKVGGFSRDLVSQARVVLRWTPKIAAKVLAGTKALAPHAQAHGGPCGRMSRRPVARATFPR